MFKLEKPNTAQITEKAKEIVKKIGKRNLVIMLAVLVIGGAVWLNIALFSEGAKNAVGGVAADTDAPSVEGNDTETTDKDAEDIDSFFASAQVDRQRSRDEAIEVLQLVIDNPEALEEAKTAALEEISKIAKDIDNEARIESLVVAKGFERCVAVINEAKCNVIVKTEETLLPNQVAQIYEIVYQQSGILPVDVYLIEKSGNV
ncbi:MAG: SpoIIIAH-like family protein [Clostridia bacterium]|nr:SpoIIIAH-like family protein [Clostridia bacterium]